VIGRTKEYLSIVFPRKKYSLKKYSKRVAELFIVHIHASNKIHKRAHLSHLLTLIPQRLVDQLVDKIFSPYTYHCLVDLLLDSSPFNFCPILCVSSFVCSSSLISSCVRFFLSLLHIVYSPPSISS